MTGTARAGPHLPAAPRGVHGDPDMEEPPTVRWVVPHMIEETARHAGYLDIARELLDGRTRLGPRSKRLTAGGRR